MPDGGPEELAAWVLIVVGSVVFAVILIPLLLFGIELIILGLLIALGILARALLGRPWVVKATPADGGPGEMTWSVSGWRRSHRVIEEVAGALAAGADPMPSEATERISGAVT
jgi:hypothetical protein